MLLETSQSYFYLFICLFQTKRSDNVQHARDCQVKFVCQVLFCVILGTMKGIPSSRPELENYSFLFVLTFKLQVRDSLNHQSIITEK